MTMAAAFETVNPAYRSALAAASARTRHSEPLEARDGLVRVEATDDSMSLAVLVDPATHVIRAAAYSNASSPVARGLFETLCDVLADVHIREADDHAVVAVEHALRDRSHPRPVAGIVLPKNADPMFRPLAGLIRQLALQYEQRAGVHFTENFFERPPSSEWAALTPAGRASTVQTALNELFVEYGYEGTMSVLRIDDLVRVTVAFDVRPAGTTAQQRLMQLERGLKGRLESSLQLYLEDLKDRNTIRTLVTPKELTNVRND